MDTTITTTPITNLNVSAQTAGNGLSGISGTDFMNILVKQLQMQDPMKPMTNQEMVQQLSTIRELEMNSRMSGKLEQLTDQQRFGSAAALIGKKVTGKVADGDGHEFSMEGVVTGINFTEKGDVMLKLDSGQTLPLTALQTVTNPGAQPAAAVPANAVAVSGTTTASTTSKSGILQRLLNWK